ncbi:SDR family oxidoreductase [Luteimicrobium subarcticum]|uniref:NAD(P)-dependent dehydrogenase (Short-subunit alcohol dehydrogenase family) n=1 Tax=Luteimicrobium subarcticum TaxID=620910 RepID=A0A2M8W422_9MICO|nr:SDR family oxidoreductase [Luteimicrobium subarcticum]PJI85676.1 NAD(P)-dependent dehydrogenase (short-subunit alcohol dehydrogenase family) [Luteimicrobium subarcticum]
MNAEDVTAGSEARVLVAAGGAGVLGRFVVVAAARAGWTVLVPTRRPDAARDVVATCADAPGTVHVVPALPDGGPGDAYDAVARRVGDLVPHVSAVVASLGGWRLGPRLLDLSGDAWHAALTDHLTAHLRAAQVYVPLLAGARDPVYVMTNGAAADVPMVGSGAVSVTGAGQRMLLDVLRAEGGPSGPRFHEVTVTAAVAGDDRNVDPVAQVRGEDVAAAVLGVLDDPGSPARVRVGP